MAKGKNKSKKADTTKTETPIPDPPKKPIRLTTAHDGKKLCPKCNRILTIDNFPTDNRRNDHLYIYCRECEAKRQYDNYTRKKIRDAEENGIVVLKTAPVSVTPPQSPKSKK